MLIYNAKNNSFLLMTILIGVLCCVVLPINAKNSRDYLILVYMNGSDLESNRKQATKAVNEMIKVSKGKNFPGIFVVETGGTKRWHLKNLQNTKNQRFIIADGEIQEIKKLRERSMGDAENFSDFLRYGMQKRAKHNILIFWNHGEGSLRGFGRDELHENDALTLQEMNKAFKDSNINIKFDLIGFDACLMSSIEVAYMLSPYGKYMLASQETEKQDGWNYNVFSKLSDNITIENLARAIMDEYIIGENQYSITLLRLGKSSKLTEVLKKALGRWDKRKEALYTKVLYSRKDMLDFGGNFHLKNLNYIYPEMVELDDVFASLAGNNQHFYSEYTKVKKEITVYHLSKNYDKTPSGISIFLPYGKDFSKRNVELYKTTEFLKEYIDFIESYYIALKDSNEFVLYNAPLLDNNDYCSLDININSNFRSIDILLLKPLKNRKYYSIGYMNQDTQISKRNIKVAKPIQWITAMGQPLYIVKTRKDFYSTPMLLKRNSKEVIINIVFDMNLKIIKILEIDDKTIVSRNLDALIPGDIIAPLYPIIKLNDINKKFITEPNIISYEKGVERRIVIQNIIGFKLEKLNLSDYQVRLAIENEQGEKFYSLPCKKSY